MAGIEAMTQREQLLKLFRDNGGRVTLGVIMQTTLAAEYRARMTELRREGYGVVLERGKKASENRYTLVEKLVFVEEQNGQLRIAI